MSIYVYTHIQLKTNTRLFSHLFPQYFSSLVRFHCNCLSVLDRPLKHVWVFLHFSILRNASDLTTYDRITAYKNIVCKERKREVYNCSDQVDVKEAFQIKVNKVV